MTVGFFRHHHYQTVMVLIMLTSWLFMLVSSTCAMPMPAQMQIPVTDTMPVGCSDSAHHGAAATQLSPNQNCTLKACPDSQPNPALNFKIDKPDLPVFILCLTWLSIYIFSPLPCLFTRHRQRRPTANPIPIRYRFCTFLN